MIKITSERRDRTDSKYKQVYYRNAPIRKYTDTEMNEDDYLQTTVWKELREKRLCMDQYICQKCGTAFNLEVHHIRYPAVWGEEDLKDLITLCDKCHEYIHRIDKQRRE